MKFLAKKEEEIYRKNQFKAQLDGRETEID